MNSKLKILLIGRYWQGSADSGIFNGLLKAGAAVQTIDTRHATGTPAKGTLGKIIFKAHEKYSLRDLPLEIIRQVKLLKPDYLITIKRTELTPEQLAECKSIGVKTVNFYPDFHFDHKTVQIESLKHFDFIFTTKSFHVDYLKKNFKNSNINFLHHGYNSLVHNPIYSNIEDSDYLHDVAYVGNHTLYKAQWLDNVISALGTTKLSIMGPNWERAEGNIKSHWMPGEIRNTLFTQAIQLSKVNIALHSGPHKNGWQDLVSMRTFEIPACRGFMLHIDNDEVRDIFEVGTELDVFSSPEECADKSIFYLANPSK